MNSPSIVVVPESAEFERTRRLANLLYAAWYHPDAAVRRRAIGLLDQVYAGHDEAEIPERAHQAKSAA